MTGREPVSFSRSTLPNAVSNHDVSAAGRAVVFNLVMHIPWCNPLASGSVMNETHLTSLSWKNKSITAVRRHNAVRVTFPYFFNSSWSSDWAGLRCEICRMLMTQSVYRLLSACRLVWSSLLWRCHRSALIQHRYPVTTRQDPGFFSDDFRGFTHFHRRQSRISLWISSRKAYSWSRFKLRWCKIYAFLASSLNNQPNNHGQKSWAASASSVAQKICFKGILKIRYR